MENWVYNRAVLYSFAKHFETGEPLPEEIYQKLLAARTYRFGPPCPTPSPPLEDGLCQKVFSAETIDRKQLQEAHCRSDSIWRSTTLPSLMASHGASAHLSLTY